MVILLIKILRLLWSATLKWYQQKHFFPSVFCEPEQIGFTGKKSGVNLNQSCSSRVILRIEARKHYP